MSNKLYNERLLNSDKTFFNIREASYDYRILRTNTYARQSCNNLNELQCNTKWKSFTPPALSNFIAIEILIFNCEQYHGKCIYRSEGISIPKSVSKNMHRTVPTKLCLCNRDTIGSTVLQPKRNIKSKICPQPCLSPFLCEILDWTYGMWILLRWLRRVKKSFSVTTLPSTL